MEQNNDESQGIILLVGITSPEIPGLQGYTETGYTIREIATVQAANADIDSIEAGDIVLLIVDTKDGTIDETLESEIRKLIEHVRIGSVLGFDSIGVNETETNHEALRKLGIRRVCTRNNLPAVLSEIENEAAGSIFNSIGYS